MARNYAALPHEYLEEMDILSDEEFGRLCRALLQYSMDGKECRLQGAEKVLWKRAKMQEDRFQESYRELTDARREAGKKGAAKRWHGEERDDTAMANDSTAMASDGKHPYTETETKPETETKTKIPPPIGGRDTPARENADPPAFEEVREAAVRRGCPECARPFFDYYASVGWRDSQGKPCAWNWQQKLVAWQQREEKQKKGAGVPQGPPTGAHGLDPAECRKYMTGMEKYLESLRRQANGGEPGGGPGAKDGNVC